MKKRNYNNGLSPFDYISQAASMAGTGGSIGGPIGAIAGAGAGLLFANQQHKQMMANARMNENMTSLNKNRQASSNMAAQYDMNNPMGMAPPGFKDGLPRFKSGKANAKVSKGEVIRDPMSGSLDKVPGEYVESNADTVPANIAPGTSVFSARDKNKLPFGKSTPADVATRLMQSQKHSEKVLSGKGSRLDKNTAELNLRNIEKQASNLDMLTYMQNPPQMAGMPGYNDGLSARDKWARSSGWDSRQGVSEEDVDNAYDDYLASKSKAGAKFGNIASSMASLAPAISNLSYKHEEVAPIYAQYMNPMQSFNMEPGLRDIRNQSSINRYNQSISGGAGMAYGAASYGNTLAAKSNLTYAAQQFNAGQVGAYAGRHNQIEGERTGEMRRTQDLNMRGAANARSIRNEGLSQVSKFAQTKQLQKNMSERDKQQLGIFATQSGLDPKALAELFKILGQ